MLVPPWFNMSYNSVPMALTFRAASPADYKTVESLLIDSFEPITWFKRVDERFGPLNGHNWRRRWEMRVAAIFRNETILLGEAGGELVAVATGTIDPEFRLGYIDLIAVDRRFQGKGYGREMLRGMLQYMKNQGAVHANLDCLTDNDAANCLYRSEGFEEVARHIRWFIKIP